MILTVDIKLEGDKDFSESALAGLSDIAAKDDEAETKVSVDKGALRIRVKSESINIARSIVNTCMNSIKLFSEINSL